VSESSWFKISFDLSHPVELRRMHEFSLGPAIH